MKIFSYFRKQKNKIRSFTAALLNRLTSDWITSFLSQDAEIRGSLKNLRNRARDLGRNDDYVRAYLRSVENNIVGSGIRLQSRIADDKNISSKINKTIEDEWAKWCRMDSVHVGGTLSFQDIERLLIRNTAESGEILVVFVYEKKGRSKIGLSLQIIESDMLDENFNGVYGDNVVRMGVELDFYGRPVAYHFLKNHPGDTQFPQKNTQEPPRVRIDARDVIHLYRHERPIQNRGFSWLSSAMLTLRHLSGFTEATIVRKRSEASVMGFIESPEGEAIGTAVQGSERVEDFAPGKFAYLSPGEKVTVPQISGGQSEFAPFTQSMIQKIATGVGSSYEELSKDYSRSNYSSSRLALISERDHWKTLQDWFSRNFHQKVYEKFIEIGVMTGVFDFKDYYLNKEKYINPKWMPRGWDWVDPLKDVTADKEALKSCLRSYSDILAEEGKDFEETMQQIKKERDIMKSLGITTDIQVQQEVKQNNLNSNGVDDNEDSEKS